MAIARNDTLRVPLAINYCVLLPTRHYLTILPTELGRVSAGNSGGLFRTHYSFPRATSLNAGSAGSAGYLHFLLVGASSDS
jgi:hypothetical protein